MSMPSMAASSGAGMSYVNDLELEETNQNDVIANVEAMLITNV